jgi:hypothetical protein
MCLLLLATLAYAGDPSVTTTMHGFIISKGEYLLEFDPEKISGTLEAGHPAIVTQVRNASKDPLQYCVLVDSGQTPELNEQIRRTAGEMIRALARPGERGRAIVFGKSHKQSGVMEWNPDPSALATFVQQPHDGGKGSDPFAPMVDCLDRFGEPDQREPHVRAVFLVAGKPTESSPWTTEWFSQRFAKLGIQLYVISFDPALITGGEEKAPIPRTPQRPGIYSPPPAIRPSLNLWYAPTLFRVARDSAGEVISVYGSKPIDFSGFSSRLRHQLEFTVVGSEKDANSYRSFKLTAPDVHIGVTTLLFLPKQ